MAPKKKQEVSDDDDLEEEEEEEKGKGKKKAPAAKKPAAKKAKVEAEVDPDQEADVADWQTVDKCLMYKNYGSSEPSSKIAAFDLDGTLITTKSGNKFAKDFNDWKFFNRTVATTLKQCIAKGMRIVIFSNQGGVKSALTGKAAAVVKGKIFQMIKQAGVPALVFCATQDDAFRKPSTGMWDKFTKELNGGMAIDKAESFYVGDAAGRPDDFMDKEGAPADSDKQFAEAIGLPFKTPEDMFGESSPNKEFLTMLLKSADYWLSGAGGGDKDHFKGNASKKAAASLSEFPDKFTLDNLKAVGKLEGVGKGTVEKIKSYFDTGTFEDWEKAKAAGKGGPASPKAQPQGAKDANAKVALGFM